MSNPIIRWVESDLSGAAGLGDAARAAISKPALPQLYAVYLTLYAPTRASAQLIGPIADFVEVLRQHEKAHLYTDEEWITFFLPYYNGDADRARDAWDGYLCQPEMT